MGVVGRVKAGQVGGGGGGSGGGGGGGTVITVVVWCSATREKVWLSFPYVPTHTFLVRSSSSSGSGSSSGCVAAAAASATTAGSIGQNSLLLCSYALGSQRMMRFLYVYSIDE